MAKKKAIIIGAGIGGLATAAILSKAGYKVKVLEKNEQIGGRAAQLITDGFIFDMGPSWYLGPDIFSNFFKLLDEDIDQHLKIVKLDPAYRIFYKDTNLSLDITANPTENLKRISQLDPTAKRWLPDYLDKAEFQYTTAINKFLHKNYDSITDFFNWDVIKNGYKLSLFQKMDRYTKKFTKNENVQKLLQYPLVFLGSSPYNTPALYSLLSHMDLTQGVFYPLGGIKAVADALANIAKKHGAEIFCDQEVTKINVNNEQIATEVELNNGQKIAADLIVSNGDIEHTENKLLSPEYQSYSKKYWKTRVIAPSGFIMFLGVKGKLPQLSHHNLVFCKDWPTNFKEIFDQPKLPGDPSFYVCMPSKTEPNVAPENCENIFVLVPVAANMELTESQIENYGEQILETMSTSMQINDLKERIIYKSYFTGEDFKSRYHSFGGSALGLAHTLSQTAIFRPNNQSKKVKNLYYVGGNTNPGIGVPMCLISAELVYKRLKKDKSAQPLTKINE